MEKQEYLENDQQMSEVKKVQKTMSNKPNLILQNTMIETADYRGFKNNY